MTMTSNLQMKFDVYFCSLCPSPLIEKFLNKFFRYASSSLRKSEYDGSPYAQELYRRPIKPPNNGFYYQQAIYEDEGMDYIAPFPVYTPGLFGKAHLY